MRELPNGVVLHDVGDRVRILMPKMTQGVEYGILKLINGSYRAVEYEFKGEKIIIDLLENEIVPVAQSDRARAF